MPSIDLQNFAFSFQHALVKVDDRQFVGVRAVSVNQELQSGVVYGTEIGPLKHAVGQLQVGQGQLTFGDYGEGTDFYRYLGQSPFTRLWTLDYTLAREDGSTRTVECRACRLNGLGIEHESGGEALAMTYPFSFLSLRIDGVDLALSVKGVAQAAIGIAQNLTNLL